MKYEFVISGRVIIDASSQTEAEELLADMSLDELVDVECEQLDDED